MSVESVGSSTPPPALEPATKTKAEQPLPKVAEVVPQRQVLESAPAVPASTSQTELDNSIEQIQVMMDLRNRSVQFTRDDTTGSNVIKVVDTESGDTIRQMPAEELLAFMRNLTRMLGTFVDKQT
ncbi:MAG TPA: hypothetical protein DDZ38_05710 [Gammaproteobacteria bacterium]|jgi:uncharacterized FlaG/YvyC family protein|nr:hypothetical protein [Gammaproteobacteria bacterium]